MIGECWNKKGLCYGQTVAEYVILVMIVLGVGAALTPMLRRGTQSVIKAATDRIGNQADSESAHNADEGGYMVSYEQLSNVTGQTQTTGQDGLIQVDYQETERGGTLTNTLLMVTETN